MNTGVNDTNSYVGLVALGNKLVNEAVTGLAEVKGIFSGGVVPLAALKCGKNELESFLTYGALRGSRTGLAKSCSGDDNGLRLVGSMTKRCDGSASLDRSKADFTSYTSLVTFGGTGGLNLVIVLCGVTGSFNIVKALGVVTVRALLTCGRACYGTRGSDSLNVVESVSGCGNDCKAFKILCTNRATLSGLCTVLGTGGCLSGNVYGLVSRGDNGTSEFDCAAITLYASLVTVFGTGSVYFVNVLEVVSGSLGCYGSFKNFATKCTFGSCGCAGLCTGSFNSGNGFGSFVRATARSECKHYAHNCDRKHEKLNDVLLH